MAEARAGWENVPKNENVLKRVSSRERDAYGGITGASANGRDGIP